MFNVPIVIYATEITIGKKGTIIKYASVVAGAIIGFTLVSQHPVHVGLLATSAAAYFIGEAIEKDKIQL